MAGPHYHENSGAPSDPEYYRLKGVPHAAGKLGAVRSRMTPDALGGLSGSKEDEIAEVRAQGDLAAEQVYAFFIKTEGILMPRHLLTLSAVMEANLPVADLKRRRDALDKMIAEAIA